MGSPGLVVPMMLTGATDSYATTTSAQVFTDEFK
jgi:hypothetical protein